MHLDYISQVCHYRLITDVQMIIFVYWFISYILILKALQWI